MEKCEKRKDVSVSRLYRHCLSPRLPRSGRMGQNSTGNGKKREAPPNPSLRMIDCEDRRIFTLIELLVVIAIIAILAALLMPALKNARDTVKRVSCASNQKQLFLPVMTYVDSYGAYIPLYGVSSLESNQLEYWYMTIGKILKLNVVESDTMEVPYTSLDPKTPSKLFLCPSGFNRVKQHGKDRLSFFYQANHYHMFPTLTFSGSVPEGKKWVNLKNLRSPSRKIQLMDFANDNNGIPGAGAHSLRTPPTGDSATSQMINDFLYGRHQRTVNSLFYDGHVESIPSLTLVNHYWYATENGISKSANYFQPLF